VRVRAAVEATASPLPLTHLKGEFRTLRDPDTGLTSLLVVDGEGLPHAVDPELERWLDREVTLSLFFQDVDADKPGRGSCLRPAKCPYHAATPGRMMATSLQGVLMKPDRWAVETESGLRNVPLQYMPGHLGELIVVPRVSSEGDPLEGVSLESLADLLSQLQDKNG
jgi:hypothetical protein